MTDQKTLYNCTVEEFVLLWWRVSDDERAAFVQRITDDPDASPDDRFKLGLAHDFTPADEDDVDQDAPPPPAVAKPFPVSALPEWARDLVTELAEQHQTPIDLPGLVALGAISAVANRIRATLKINSTWVEGPNLYLAISLPPGAGKSPVMKALLGPVAGIEADEVKKARRAMHEIAADIVSIEKRAKTLKGQLESTEDPGPKLKEDYADTLGDLADAEARIDDGRILADDVTPEALGKLLHRNAGTISLISTEGGLFDSLGRYVERGTPPNLDTLLKIWSGDTIKVDRVGRDAVDLDSPRATVCLTVQPSVVAKVLGNNEFVGRGLVARFMIAQPESYVGRRNMADLADVDAEAAARWERGLRAMYTNETRHIGITRDAQAAFGAFRQSLESRRFIGGDLEAPSLTEMSTKCESSVARVALLIALAEGATSVELDHMNRAMLVGHYWLTQAIVLAGGGEQDALKRRVDRFSLWVEERADGPVSVRDVIRSGMFRRTGNDTSDDIVEVFERAEQLGRGSIDWSKRSPRFVPEAARQTRDTRDKPDGIAPSVAKPTTEGGNEESLSRMSRAPKDVSGPISLSLSSLPSNERATCATNAPEPDPDNWDEDLYP